MRRRGLGLAAVASVVVAAAAVGTSIATRGHATPQPRPRGVAGSLSSSLLAARFAVLSQAHSNRCGMPASALDRMAPGARLQGACCFPMDYDSYASQVRELNRRYPDDELIPKDPYDIPVSLAKRLIGFESIKLTAAQQRIYKRAIPLSTTKGPCCCPCWRWTAFGGQAKYLITRRRYSAKQIAAVWSLEEGCGGPSHRA